MFLTIIGIYRLPHVRSCNSTWTHAAFTIQYRIWCITNTSCRLWNTLVWTRFPYGYAESSTGSM